MTSVPQSGLWAIRDARCLSAMAKLAYYSLWTRQPDVRPSYQTLGRDMGASRATAKRAVRELEEAGLLKRVPRLKAKGDNDANLFYLVAPPEGWGQADLTPVHCDPTPGVRGTPEASNDKDSSEGSDRQGSRRARPAVSRAWTTEQKIAFTRQAIADVYGDDENQEISDGQAFGLWDRLVEDRAPAAPIKYLVKIFTETPYLDTHLAMVDPDDDPWDYPQPA